MSAFVITQRISYSGTDIDFAKLRDNIQTDDLDHIIHKTKSGGTVTYKRTSQLEWNLDIICTEAEADVTIRSWITNRRQIVFVPDQGGAPGTTHNTQILNRQFSFAPWGEGKWRGTLNLRKV